MHVWLRQSNGICARFGPLFGDITIIGIGAFVASFVLTGLVRKLASAIGVLDVPNARSSHTVPTPRGGGLAIVLVVTSVISVAVVLGRLSWQTFAALAGGGLAVAAIGLLDDRRPVPAAVRLVVHFAAAVWALVWLGGLPVLQIGSRFVQFGIEGYVLGALGIVWVLNLYNFMDGIDGIAASESIFILGSAAGLALLTNGPGGDIPIVSVALGAACAGFLVWNWPPARIFMGDVGSGYLGFTIAVLALVSARENAASLLAWLILGGVFFVDATVTFIRRLARGEAPHVAHRSHAYQWLSRRWGSHLRVTLAILLLNLLWLLPLAAYAWMNPALAAWVAGVAILPLIFLAIASGSGRPEV
jgi:Fuc2NAc and GlcNAc transferase